MKKLTLLTASLLFASLAQARPSTWEMTCTHTEDIVKNSRGIVLNYEFSDKGSLYKLYFPYAYMCYNEGPYQGKAAYVKTSDKSSCFIGYECVPRDNNRGDGGGRGGRRGPARGEDNTVRGGGRG